MYDQFTELNFTLFDNHNTIVRPHPKSQVVLD